MRNNRVFWKALHSLSHPLSILAILLLLFNDHYLRHFYPSWLTGKLGDFTWLLFAPFIAAMLFSFLAPQRPRFIGLLSMGFIGLWFASFKTMPFVMNLTKDVLESLVGWRGTLGMDVTDLITLPALLISWHIWKNAPEDKRYLRPVIYVGFGLGLLGTMASDDTIYLDAVNQICEAEDGALYTFTNDYGMVGEPASYSSLEYVWESRNGGLTWQNIERFVSLEEFEPIQPMEERCSDRTLSSVANLENGTLYRWEQGEKIEYSVDEGATWLLLHDLTELEQDARIYANHNNGDSSAYIPYLLSPVSGLVHSQTGNLVLAMSRDGVLVILPSGAAEWVTVSNYGLANLGDWAFIQKAFGLYFLLIPTLICLIMVSTITLIHSERFLTRIWLVVGWLSYVILLIFVHPANVGLDLNVSGDYADIIVMWGLIALASLFVIALPMSIWAFYLLIRRYQPAFTPIIITSVLALLANFFPLFLWSQGTIPRYYVAMFFSVFLTGAVLAACYSYYRPKLPSRFIPEKAKRKNDEL